MSNVRGVKELSDRMGHAEEKFVTVAAYQIKKHEHIIYADATDNVVVLTLPSMADAIGKFYYIEAINATNDVSVNVKETATEISTYGDLDTAEDRLMLFCTGRRWVVVVSALT